MSIIDCFELLAAKTSVARALQQMTAQSNPMELQATATRFYGAQGESTTWEKMSVLRTRWWQCDSIEPGGESDGRTMNPAIGSESGTTESTTRMAALVGRPTPRRQQGLIPPAHGFFPATMASGARHDGIQCTGKIQRHCNWCIGFIETDRSLQLHSLCIFCVFSSSIVMVNVVYFQKLAYPVL
jgi:hypothetical protein